MNVDIFTNLMAMSSKFNLEAMPTASMLTKRSMPYQANGLAQARRQAKQAELFRLRDSLLGRLCAKLKLLSRESRRSALAQFSHSQRLSLEEWMLRRKHVPAERKAVPAPRKRRSMKPVKALHPMRGVVEVTQRGKRSFYALACVGMLRLSSRKSGDQQTALRHRRALEAAATQLRGLLDKSFPACTEDLCHQAVSSIQEEGSTLPELGLRLQVRLWAQRWVAQSLATPTLEANDVEKLRLGLEVWQKLEDGRKQLHLAGAAGGRGALPTSKEETAWRSLREAFLDVNAKASAPVRSAHLAAAEDQRRLRWQQLEERRKIPSEQMAVADTIRVRHKAASDNSPLSAFPRLLRRLGKVEWRLSAVRR